MHVLSVACGAYRPCFGSGQLEAEITPVKGGRRPLWFTMETHGLQNIYHAAASKKPRIIKKWGEPNAVPHLVHSGVTRKRKELCQERSRRILRQTEVAVA
jgi:hypothetical protein